MQTCGARHLADLPLLGGLGSSLGRVVAGIHRMVLLAHTTGALARHPM